MTAELVSDAVEQAITRRTLTIGTICTRIKACSNRRMPIAALLLMHGFIQSITRKGDYWDNAPIEWFCKTRNDELIYPMRKRQ